MTPGTRKASGARPVVERGNGAGTLWRAVRTLRTSPPVVGLVGGLRRNGGMILRYHSVNADPGWSGDYIQPSLVTPPDVFDRQMAFLAARYRVVPLSAIVESLAAGRDVDRRCVAVTFDDGYEDNYRFAFPILRRHGLTATFFVTTGSVGERPPLWTLRLRRSIRKSRHEEIRPPFVHDRPVPLRTEDEREEAIRWLTTVVKHCTAPEADEIVGDVLEAAGDPGCDRRTMMTWGEMREMIEGGMSVGAHTVSHYNLPSLDSKTAAREIDGSRQELAAELGRDPEHFAYPNGRTSRHCDARIAGLVAAAGFSAAVTSIAGPAARQYSRFGLPRLGVVPRDRDTRRLEADIQYARVASPMHDSLDDIRRSSRAADGTAGALATRRGGPGGRL